MFCPKRGSEIQEGSKFCSSCGAQISTNSSKEAKFIYELNGVKFDAFKVAWDTKLFCKRSFIHTADTTNALKKLTGAGSWAATKMERKMKELEIFMGSKKPISGCNQIFLADQFGYIDFSGKM